MHVLITGASDGIGASTALAFAAKGARVSLVARRRQLLESVAAEVTAAGGQAHVAVADIGDGEQIRAAIEGATKAFGPIDVLVNNAGMPGGTPFADIPYEQVERVTSVNLLGTIRATHAVVPSMVARGHGTIVNVASIAGRVGVPGAAAYSGTKFGVAGLSDSLWFELRPRGVRVILINPGPIRTASWPHTGVPSMLVLGPDTVARAIVRAVARGTPERTIPWYYRPAQSLKVLAPPLYRSMMHRFAAFKPDVEG